MKLLCSDQSNDVVTFKFEGRAVGAFVLAGPDAGTLEVSIDNEPFRAIDLYHHYSNDLHYPRTVMFATELPKKIHTVSIRLAKPKKTGWSLEQLPPSLCATIGHHIRRVGGGFYKRFLGCGLALAKRY